MKYYMAQSDGTKKEITSKVYKITYPEAPNHVFLVHKIGKSHTPWRITEPLTGYSVAFRYATKAQAIAKSTKYFARRGLKELQKTIDKILHKEVITP